jgi:DNA polymerase delta subunit 1
LQLVRRDNAPLVKEAIKECLDHLLFGEGSEAALSAARRHILAVLRDENPVDKYVVSKQLRTGYANPTQPHVIVAEKIRQRTGEAPPSGARVPYVYIEDPKFPDGQSSLRAEDPAYVTEEKITIDRMYYVTNQLEKPLVSLFEPVCDDPRAALFDHEEVSGTLEDVRGKHNTFVKTAKRVRKNEQNRQHEITKFFKKMT